MKTASVMAVLLFVTFILHKISSLTSSADREYTSNQESLKENQTDPESQFNESQKILWDKSPERMTINDLREEIYKCQNAIREDFKSPYEWIFNDYDAEKSLEIIRTSPSPSINVYGQVRTEVSRAVRVAEYNCHFRGSGFHMYTKGIVQYIDQYIPQ